jgi:predicted DNA-binding protein with PD1-like motif
MLIKVTYTKFKIKRNFLVRVKHDSDFLQFLEELARKEKIITASFTAIGALKWATIGFYDQEKHEYQKIKIDSPSEIVCCIGNLSLKDKKPFVHAHAVLADSNGNTKGGHLLEGKVFAAEIHLYELDGIGLERKYDKITGLSLWEIK